MRRKFLFQLDVEMPDRHVPLNLEDLAELLEYDEGYQDTNTELMAMAIRRAGGDVQVVKTDVRVDLEEAEMAVVIDAIKADLIANKIPEAIWLKTNLIESPHVSYVGHPRLTDTITEGPVRFITTCGYKGEVIQSPLMLQAYREFSKAYNAGAKNNCLEDILYTSNETGGVKVFTLLGSTR